MSGQAGQLAFQSSDPHNSNPLRVIGLIDMDAFYAQVVVPFDHNVAFVLITFLVRAEATRYRSWCDHDAAFMKSH